LKNALSQLTGIAYKNQQAAKCQNTRRQLHRQKGKRKINLIQFLKEDAGQIIQTLQDMITMRAKGFTESNRRNYYGEYAASIAALGETKESRGEWNGKAKLMEYYKTMYSRRRAFHEELRKFGMRK